MSRGLRSSSIVNRLLRHRLLGLRTAFFVAGAVLLSIGLIGFFNEGEEPALQESVSDINPISIRDVENLPVAIPYYNPRQTVVELEPEPQPALPVRIVIESIGVDSPVVEMGMDEQRIPYVPLNGQDVAWYNFSSLPGEGGNAVLAGHINWQQAPAVFSDLDDLQLGETIRLISEDGREYTYQVFANFFLTYENPYALQLMTPTLWDTVTLFTCGGTWIPDPNERFGGSYTNRTVVRARLVESSLALPVPVAMSES